jgi:hypothetical protein
MTRGQLIDETLQKLNKLPDDKIQEVKNYADFLISKIEDQIVIDGIAVLTAKSKTFEFLNEEEELYTVNDVIEKYK